jgi:hypothetical protein
MAFQDMILDLFAFAVQAIYPLPVPMCRVAGIQEEHFHLGT